MTARESMDKLLSVAELQEGDIVDLSSDYTSLYFYAKKNDLTFDGNALLDSLTATLSNSGTLLIRTFNWDFCHGKAFDISNTKSQVGELGNIALGRKDFKRTKHPIYSWMVKGKHQEELCLMNNKESFGSDSPWRFFEEKDAKMLILGNTNAFGLTCLHYIEQEIGIDYRYEKEFHGQYTDENGVLTERAYSMYVRKLDRQVLFNSNSAFQRLCEFGAMETCIVDGYIPVSCMSYRKACRLIRDDFLRKNISAWVSIRPLED